MPGKAEAPRSQRQVGQLTFEEAWQFGTQGHRVEKGAHSYGFKQKTAVKNYVWRLNLAFQESLKIDFVLEEAISRK